MLKTQHHSVIVRTGTQESQNKHENQMETSQLQAQMHETRGLLEDDLHAGLHVSSFCNSIPSTHLNVTQVQDKHQNTKKKHNQDTSCSTNSFTASNIQENDNNAKKYLQNSSVETAYLSHDPSQAKQMPVSKEQHSKIMQANSF